MTATIHTERTEWADGTVTVDYATDTQAFSMTVPAEHADIVAALLPHCAYGPAYRRGVADALGTYYRIVRRNGVGDAQTAAYWLEQARGSVTA